MAHGSREIIEPGPEGRRVLKGPGLSWWAGVDAVLAAVWLVAALYNNSDAGPADLLTLGLGAGGLYLAGAWVIRSVVALVTLGPRPRRWEPSAAAVGHVLIPLVGLLGVASGFTRLDTRARFELSQAAFEREAEAVRAGRPNTGPRWVGFYRVQSTYLGSDGSVRFNTRDAFLFTQYGFALPGDGPLIGIGGSIETQPLVGRWEIYQQYD